MASLSSLLKLVGTHGNRPSKKRRRDKVRGRGITSSMRRRLISEQLEDRRLLAAAPFSETFDGFTGSGFASSPVAGQLNSNDWRVGGLSDAPGVFGGEFTTADGDFAKGVSSGGVSSGGIYAFSDGGNVFLGAQPTGSDFTPGTITLKIDNMSGTTVSDWTLSYDLLTLNNGDRGNTFNFAYSTDDAVYNNVAALDYLSPETADMTPTWVTTPRGTVLTGVPVADGQSLYLQWSSDDSTGGGSRDEIGIDNVSVMAGGMGPALPDMYISELLFNPPGNAPAAKTNPTSTSNCEVPAVRRFRPERTWWTWKATRAPVRATASAT